MTSKFHAELGLEQGQDFLQPGHELLDAGVGWNVKVVGRGLVGDVGFRGGVGFFVGVGVGVVAVGIWGLVVLGFGVVRVGFLVGVGFAVIVVGVAAMGFVVVGAATLGLVVSVAVVGDRRRSGFVYVERC